MDVRMSFQFLVPCVQHHHSGRFELLFVICWMSKKIHFGDMLKCFRYWPMKTIVLWVEDRWPVRAEARL